MSDVAAGAAYGLWGSLSTVYGFALGPAIDALGVRRALFASFAAGTGAKLALALCRSRRVALFVLYGPLSAAAALGVPVLTIGVRRATHEANRGAAYGLFYSLMNVAALIAGANPRSSICACAVLTFLVVIRLERGCFPAGHAAGAGAAQRGGQRAAAAGAAGRADVSGGGVRLAHAARRARAARAAAAAGGPAGGRRP